MIPGFIVVESGFGEGIGNRSFWEKMERNGGVVLKRACTCSFIPEICFNFVGNKVNGSESGIIYCTQVVERK